MVDWYPPLLAFLQSGLVHPRYLARPHFFTSGRDSHFSHQRWTHRRQHGCDSSLCLRHHHPRRKAYLWDYGRRQWHRNDCGPGVGGYLASGETYLGAASPELTRRSRSSRLRRIFTSLCLKRSDAPINQPLSHSIRTCIASRPLSHLLSSSASSWFVASLPA